MTDAELDARLGELLVSSKALDTSRVDTAKVYQQARGGTLAGAVLSLNLATDKVVRMLLEEITGIKTVDPSLMTVYPDFLERVNTLVPAQVWLAMMAFPAQMEVNRLHVCLLNPTDARYRRSLESLSGCQVVPLAGHRAGGHGGADQALRGGAAGQALRCMGEASLDDCRGRVQAGHRHAVHAVRRRRGVVCQSHARLARPGHAGARIAGTRAGHHPARAPDHRPIGRGRRQRHPRRALGRAAARAGPRRRRAASAARPAAVGDPAGDRPAQGHGRRAAHRRDRADRCAHRLRPRVGTPDRSALLAGAFDLRREGRDARARSRPPAPRPRRPRRRSRDQGVARGGVRPPERAAARDRAHRQWQELHAVRPARSAQHRGRMHPHRGGSGRVAGFSA